jgi:hypothetical protein
MEGKMRNALFGALLAALLAAAPLASNPAHALALSAPARMSAAIDETSVAPQVVQYYYGGYYRPWRAYRYGYYRPWRPYYGYYRPWRPYYGYYRPWRPYYGYYRPYYRPVYYGYYRPWRPYYAPVFYGPRVSIGFGWGPRVWW